MKILKLNEHIEVEDKILKHYNYTKYIYRKISPKGYDLITAPYETLEEAVKMYNNTSIYKETDTNYYIIVEETSRTLTQEEIELLSNANKYNL
jgi:hypothetical protein